MKNIRAYFTAMLIVLISACGGGGGSNGGGASSVTAPTAIAGKVYRMTITSGSGFYATTGTYTVSFSSTQNIYTVTGDGVNVVDSAGTYTYSASGNVGSVSIVDSLVGNGSFALTFTSATGGTFVATASSDPNSSQSGSFVEI